MNRSVTALCLISLAGCDGGPTVPPAPPSPRTDGGPVVGRDAGPPVVPAMGLVILIGDGLWGSADLGRVSLTVGVRVSNGAAAAPASLAPAGFQLETRGGVVVSAMMIAGPGRCAADLSVAGGASLGCLLEFQVPQGDLPRTMRYQVDGRSAQASFDACDAAHPSALCQTDQLCVGGACQAMCGPAFCTAAQVCHREACVDPCSAAHPAGPCPAGGGCYNGQCDLSCKALSPASACLDCLQTTTMCRSVSFNCDTPAQESCIRCLSVRDLCTCAASVCQPCSGAAAALDCLFVACPACAR